jgi:hypothetical protein
LRYRIILPLVSVILGVFLFHLGDIEVRRTVVANGGAPEGMADAAATAKYVHYALNTPAWVITGDTRETRWSQSTYWTGHDLLYFVAVIVLWYLIGLKLDKGNGINAGYAPPNTVWFRILAWACLLYGVFVCYSVIPKCPSFMTSKNCALALLSWGHGWWFVAIGLAWGLGLISGSVYSLSRSRVARSEQPG